MKVKNIIVFLFIIILSCKNSKEEIYLELDRFDSSLDSLILVKTFDKPNILIFEADTLRNNPKMIEETCYQIIGNDSIKIDANGHIYKFENNELIYNSSEDFLGRKFVQKNIYFTNKIDNILIEKLRKTNSDTIYFGKLNKYDNQGRLIKRINSGIWNEINNGILDTRENRIIEIYKYNKDNTVTTWRKEYFNKKYDIDSLRQAKITTFTSSPQLTWSKYHEEYTYKKDEFGNWIEKRRNTKENPEVYYRKYYY